MAIVHPFERPLRIRFAHCDPAGIVFFPQYLVMINDLVEDWVSDALGVPYAELLGRRRTGMPTVSLQCEFTRHQPHGRRRHARPDGGARWAASRSRCRSAAAAATSSAWRAARCWSSPAWTPTAPSTFPPTCAARIERFTSKAPSHDTSAATARLGRPKGYANGVAVRGRQVFVAGMIGWDGQGQFHTDDLAGQVRQALHNVVAVLAEAGAKPEHIVRMTWYVTDKREYLREAREIGAIYRAVIGSFSVAMTAVQVAALIEDRAKVEIEVTAVIPD